MENTTLMLNLSESEMLALCKRVMNLEPARRDCVVERDDGIDLDAWILTRARAWYARLLQEGPLEWVPVEDVKMQVTATADSHGVVKAVYPDGCMRPVEWQLDGWHRSVTHFARPDDETDLLQRNPWTRGGVCRPVAVDHGSWLMLYSLPAGTTPVVTMARCVTYTSGRYAFSEAAIPSLTEALAAPISR